MVAENDPRYRVRERCHGRQGDPLGYRLNLDPCSHTWQPSTSRSRSLPPIPLRALRPRVRKRSHHPPHVSRARVTLSPPRLCLLGLAPIPCFLHPSTGRRSVWSPGVPSESCLRVEVQVRAENSSRASPKGGRVGSPRRRCLSAPFHVALATSSISPPDLARAPRPSHSPTGRQG